MGNLPLDAGRDSPHNTGVNTEFGLGGKFGDLSLRLNFLISVAFSPLQKIIESPYASRLF